MKSLIGTGVALITPFHPNGEVDVDGLKRVVNFQIDNGIDYLEINSPLSVISYEHGIGAGYAAAVFNGYLYLGTNQGVLYRKWDEFLLNNND